jgi:hypothetical protein
MRTSLCWLVLVAAACRGDKPASPPPPPAGSAAAAAPAAGVAIFVNGETTATVAAAQVASWPRLDALVPAGARRLGTWESVALTGAKAQPTVVAHPSGAYPDMVPALFPGDGGAPAFGMFDPVELARHGRAALREDHITAIRIVLAANSNRGQNDDSAGGGGGDPAALAIAVKTAAGTTTLTGSQLLALPREPSPGNPDQKGWRLTALLAAAGVKDWNHLVLHDAGGTSLPLDRKDVDDASVPFIKLNKKGALRLRVFKKVGDGWNPAGDLSGLAAIDVQ